MNGGWGAWSSYSSCSKTCGVGIKSRHRSCDNPEPYGGGDNCVGDHEQSTYCNMKPCPCKKCVMIQSEQILKTTSMKLYSNRNYLCFLMKYHSNI